LPASCYWWFKTADTRVVTLYRQGQKTDANDTLAIYEAFQRNHLKASPHKMLEQQGLEELENVRAHYQSRKNKLSNAIRAIWLNLV